MPWCFCTARDTSSSPWLHLSENALSTPWTQEACLKEWRETERGGGWQRGRRRLERGGRKHKKARSLWDLTAEGNAKPHLEFTPWEAAVASFIGGTKVWRAIFIREQFSWEQYLREQEENRSACGKNKILLLGTWRQLTCSSLASCCVQCRFSSCHCLGQKPP